MGPEAKAARAKTILLVEDDPGVARLERLRLERAGYEVATAASAEEGLNRVAGGGIDLIVLDQQLSPGTSGLEFFRQVKAAGHNVPAILVTGMQEEGLLVEALRAGVRDFVPKTPNFLNHLEPIVARVLEQVGTERELAESRVVARANEERRRELEHEIAQRKRVEGALREAEENLRRMIESVKDVAIFTVDPRGSIVSWNSGAEHLFGHAEHEIIGRGFAVIFTPEDRDAGVPERELATAAARGHSNDERWHIRKDGSRFFASGVVSPIYDEEGRLCGFTKVARDITERNRAEEAVREAAVRLKAIVDTAVDGIITMDESGIIESMNPAAGRIFGHAHEEVVGRGIAMLMPEPYLSEHDGYLESYLRSGQPKIIGAIREVHGRRKDGSVFPMELAVSESRLGARRIFTGIVRDITEYKRAVEERTRLLAELGAERALLNTLLDNAARGFRLLRPGPALRPAQPSAGRTRRPAAGGPPRPAHARGAAPDVPRGLRRLPPRAPHRRQRREPGIPRRDPAQPRPAPILALQLLSRQDARRHRPGRRRRRHRHRRPQAHGGCPQGGRPAQGPVPGHARPRAAQPPGADQQRRADHEGPGLERPQLPVVGQSHRGPGQADDPDGRRSARRLADHPRQGRAPEGPRRPPGRCRPGRRGQPALDRGLPSSPDRRAARASRAAGGRTRRGWRRCSRTC